MLGLSNEVYKVASPPHLEFHTAIRKAESVVGFALVALTMAWWLRPRRAHLTTTLVAGTAIYSALIEVGQRLEGSYEQLVESVFDVACGALGGYIVAALIALAARRNSKALRQRK